MWPRTSCSLSSLTLNIVLGRASVTSPSISIFSSLGMRGERVAAVTWWPGPLPPLESRLARPVVEERADRVLQVLGLEQAAGDVGSHLVGPLDPALEVGADDALRRAVRLRRSAGEPLGEAHPLLVELGVGKDSVDDVPALEGRRLVDAAAHHELPRPRRPGPLRHPLRPTGAGREADDRLDEAEPRRLRGP